MPSPRRQLTLTGARDRIIDRCFAGTAAGRVGLECEWIAVDAARPDAAPPIDQMRECLDGPLPSGGRVTFEPGGQVEVSGPAFDGVAGACQAMGADLAHVRARLSPSGISLLGVGMDPRRRPCRQVTEARYTAMEAFFDGDGPHGRRMMCSTAAVQVNLDLGDGDVVRRWRLAHSVGPVLAAAFANSPLAECRLTGHRSSRLATWWAIDPSRTAPVDVATAAPADAWVDYVLAARVMLIRDDGGRCTPLVRRMPFAAWMSAGHELGWPTTEDLDYHLTTLFPPVRPRGWMELRFLDSLPDEWWPVAAAVTSTLIDDPEAADAAEQAAAPAAGRWLHAARDGLRHPVLETAARRCFAAALAALSRRGADPDLQARCAAFVDQYVDRGRCPADDVIDARRGADGTAPTSEELLWT